MFGYHDSNRCAFDLWAPQAYHSCKDADKYQPGYGVWESTPYRCAIDNRAFSAYAKHTQELEDIITAITNGHTDNIQTNDYMGNDDLRYIENALRDRYGIEADLSFN